MPAVAAFAATAVAAVGSAIATVGAYASIATALVVGSLPVAGSTVLALSSLGGLLATSALTSIGFSLVGGVLSGTPNLGQQGGSQTDWKADPAAGVPYAVGRTGTAGTIAYRASAGAKNKYETFVTVLSGGGPIDAHEAFYCNSAAIGFGADGGEGQDGFWRNRMWWKVSLGARPATHLTWTATGSKDTPANHGGIPADWDAACKLSGLAHHLWTLEYDTTIYAGGQPKPLSVVRGVLCYDPRLDSTYPGGAGPHRWADPKDTAAHDAAQLTWTWTENPQLHGLNWLLGRWERDPSNPASTHRRTLGVGAPWNGIDVAAFVDGANVADAHGWKVSGVVYSTGNKFDILTSILQAGSARPVSVGAKISCLTNAPKVSLDTITGDDLLGEAQIAASQRKRDRINAIWPRYLEENAGWEIVPTGIPVRVAAYEAADGGQRTKEVEYSLVPSSDQAATLARYDIENTRETGPHTLPLKPYWSGYKGGDCLTVDEPELGLVGQKCLVLNRQLDLASMAVTMTLRSETDAKHPFALGETADPPPLPALTTDEHLRVAPGGDVFAAAPDAEAGADGSLPVVVITGEVDSAFALALILDYRQVFDDGTYGDWNSQEFPLSTDNTYRLRGLAPGGVYQLHARYRTAAGGSDFDTHADLGVVTVGGVTATNTQNVGDRTSAALNALATASDSAINAAGTGLAARVTALDGQLNDPTLGAFAKIDSLTTETVDTANTFSLVSRLGVVEADLNTPSTGLYARVASQEYATTNLSNTGSLASRLGLTESALSTPSTGLLARVSDVETATTDLAAGKADASRADALEATVAGSGGTPGLTARVGVVESAVSSLDDQLSAFDVSLRAGTSEVDFRLVASAKGGSAARLEADIVSLGNHDVLVVTDDRVTFTTATYHDIGSVRRIDGDGFGPDGLLMWVGSTSYDAASASKTNAKCYIDANGFGVGGAATGGAPTPITGATEGAAPGLYLNTTVTTGRQTATATYSSNIVTFASSGRLAIGLNVLDVLAPDASYLPNSYALNLVQGGTTTALASGSLDGAAPDFSSANRNVAVAAGSAQLQLVISGGGTSGSLHSGSAEISLSALFATA